jgi:signal transduction histidine kinase
MAKKDKHPAPERNQTDASLRNEREKTDQELGKSDTHIKKGADAVVEHARELADETLKGARAKARAKLDRAGATSEARASAKAEQVTEEAALTAERRTADVQLENEREERRRAIASLLRLERGQTDKHLTLERESFDEGLDDILAELAEAVRIREEFLTLASHQLKTPLTPLALGLQSLAREAAKQPDSSFAQNVNGYIETANRQVRKLSALVAGLLDVSGMAAGKLRLVVEPVDLGTVVRDVAARYRPRAEKAGCVLDVDAPGVTGRWDKLRLEQVVTNLIENAIAFGPGKPIRIRLQASSEKARLTVRDQGIGIAPHHQSRIFERFERAVSSRNYSGFGLGLYICRTIVEALDGTISVQSDPGRGSTFTVELPLSGPRDAVDPPDTAKPASPE